jgi:hypothetical protein
MIYISHRGNIDGKNLELENNPEYVQYALLKNYNVEVDVWYVDNSFYLGHDEPTYRIDVDFIINKKIWCHAKNIDSILEMSKYDIHYFWHESDKITLTSKNYIWAYPSFIFPKNSVAVLPEKYNSDVSNCIGICSDYIIKYTESL